MSVWMPASRQKVQALLEEAMEVLHPAHRDCFEMMRVPIRTVPVDAYPGESVFVVAECAGKVLYYSDIEDGWELEFPTASGGINNRGSNQFTLSNILWQLCGEPK